MYIYTYNREFAKEIKANKSGIAGKHPGYATSTPIFNQIKQVIDADGFFYQ